MIDLSGCALEKLGDEGDFAIFRVTDQRNLSPAFLMMTASERAAPGIAARLDHAYALRNELDVAWAARPLEMGYQHGKPTLLMHDPGGVTLDRLLGEPMELGRFLRAALGIATALGRCHAKRLIHRDIKPANILVNASTGEAWLTGFGLASRLPHYRQAPDPPETIAGTLAYMAPEQTGRVNRSVDSRSDLYALGVTLYEMLVGALPFTATDSMEWVHCHIARKPIPPSERVSGIPSLISDLVLKLLAKVPEERYQTAAGVETDLRICLAALQSEGQVKPFPLGSHDMSDRLLIPERLYGREREIEKLLAAFDQIVSRGTTGLVLVSGYSGVGKSSVVNELHKALVPPRGLFVSGKFDQFKRDIPYATLAQAFQELVRQILVRSDAEVTCWRKDLEAALGPNGQIIVNLIPEIELIIGKQPPVRDLPPHETKNRFQTVLRRFIGVFARPEHPLALFLDDLQWLDSATLELLEYLLSEPDVRHLMIVGAYRDNEVGPTHPLMRTLDVIRQAGASLEEIVLAPLALGDLNALVADAFRVEKAATRNLAELMYEKTGGNPFFAIQFFVTLADEGLVTFDADQNAWRWDLARIRAKGYTDNIVVLMSGKLAPFPARTQEILQYFACLGNAAEIATLAMICDETAQSVESSLTEVIEAGLVLRFGQRLAFLHDRVQEAAYALIPDGQRPGMHLKIGRILAGRIPPEEIEENIFEIVNQLNRGSALILSTEERERVAFLNLAAGKRAKAATAYASARVYLAAGRALLPDDAWDRRYALTFQLDFHRADCEFLTGELAMAEQRLAALALRAENIVDRATVACLQVVLYTALDRSDRAIDICFEFLRGVGITWPEHPTREEVNQEYEQIWQRIEDRSIEDLVNLPLISNPDWRATIEVLTAVQPAALYIDQNLNCLVVCRMVNLSLEHGNCDASCYAYVIFSMILGPQFGAYHEGFRFGKVAFDLVEQRGLDRFKARVLMCFGNIVSPWTQHARIGRPLVRRAFVAAQESGDLTFAVYSCHNLVTNLLVCGAPLDQVQREAEGGMEFARKARISLAVDFITGQIRLIMSLRGLLPEFGSFNDAEFDENRFEEHLDANPSLSMATCWYWIRKLQARYHANDNAGAIAAAAKAERFLWTSPSFLEVCDYHFYAALAHAAQYAAASPEERPGHLEALLTHKREVGIGAANCPENFQNRAAMIDAEIARITGRNLDAIHLYEKAIQSAREHGFVNNEGMAFELAARFCTAQGLDSMAEAHLKNARRCYLRWGALGKVRKLEQDHMNLREPDAVKVSSQAIDTTVKQLDLEAVVKMSQAVSSEILLDKLIETIMVTVVEHAGAVRGLLFLAQGADLQIGAEATTEPDGVKVLLRSDRETVMELPESILRYVVRSQEQVILEDALTPNPFSEDAYIRGKRIRSVMCLPLVRQTRLIGVLYLENDLSSHVFTPRRVTALQVLASQAAISLENARLFLDLQRAEESARLMASLVENSTDFIGIARLEGQVMFVNPAGRRMVGLDPDADVSIYDKRDFYAPGDTLLLAQEVNQTLMREGHWVGERVMRHFKTNAEIPVFQNVFLITERETNRQLAATICRDITQLKRAEKSLRETQAELARVTRATTVGAFAASIAHEVNQPIAGVIMNGKASLRWLERAEKDGTELVEVRQAIQRLIRDGNRAGEIIARIRSLFKKGEAAREPLDINATIREIIVLTRVEMDKKRIALRLNLAPDLPQVLGDRVQLQQVLLNLILNAIEAMSTVENRSKELVIGTEARDAAEVLVTVCDSGIGLDVRSAEQIFNAFYTTKAGGLGMGLSISRSIVEGHSGRLWARANEGPGASFHFTLLAHRDT
jgi:PAS domain S-box-containing protein